MRSSILNFLYRTGVVFFGFASLLLLQGLVGGNAALLPSAALLAAFAALTYRCYTLSAKATGKQQSPAGPPAVKAAQPLPAYSGKAQVRSAGKRAA